VVEDVSTAAAGLSVDHMIRIGPEGLEDGFGLLRELLGGKHGWILGRPDLHVAWARHSTERH
jgi:hypothetical protein